MVCVACLLPLFLIPVINALPLLFDFIMKIMYRLFGWEYKKPERVPPACPIKPSSNTLTKDVYPIHKPLGSSEDLGSSLLAKSNFVSEVGSTRVSPREVISIRNDVLC
ncbi:hypothetical protein ACHQM5_010108 [Ranunculus cassubicifolius]